MGLKPVLKHHFIQPSAIERAVVIGAGGFVGRAVVKKLIARGVATLGLARPQIDLLSPNAGERLTKVIHKGDTLVMIAAQAPVKNHTMLIDNLRMMASVCAAIGTVQPAHVIYVSSDAVYADAEIPLTETFCAQPASLHGVMHLAREVMLANMSAWPLCILRPTLIYGPGDPHNGYGPNRFRRLAHEGKDIALFGAGEERRDHVFIDDVAEIIARCVVHRSEGVLNIASGVVTSFREIAERVAQMVPNPPAVRDTPRIGPMPHRGYRPFDVSATAAAFSDFKYTSLAHGLVMSQEQEYQNG